MFTLFDSHDSSMTSRRPRRGQTSAVRASSGERMTGTRETPVGRVTRVSSLARQTHRMMIPVGVLALFCLVALSAHLASTCAAIVRCRHRGQPAPRPAEPVTVVRPVCGLDNYAEDTLRSTFHLDHPVYEIIFCAAHAHDSAVRLVQRLIADHPGVPARLLVGDDRISDNPKLNNVCKGWRAAAHDWVVIADSNVLMPPDYIER